MCPFFIFKKFYLFIYDCGGSLLLSRFFSSCSKQGLLSSCDARASHCSGFSCCGAWALGCVGLSSCGSQSLEHRLNSCSAWASLLCSMWDLPGPGIEHMPPALAGRLFTAEPPRKPFFSFLPPILH